MSEPSSVFMFPLSAPTQQGHTEYLPPAGEVLDKYAAGVCQKLADTGYQGAANPKTVTEFAAFLKVATAIRCEQLNTQIGDQDGEEV